MKFEKIIIPPGWKDSFTKYPNGRTIFEALSQTITSVNEGIEEVNEKVNQGLLAIDQAENTIRQEITESFNTLQLQLEGEVDELSNDLNADFALLQSEVLTLIAGKANAADVYTKQQVDAQLAEKAKAVDVYTKQQVDAQLADIETLKADKLTTYTRTEIDTKDDLKANKMQEEWITPTLLNGAVGSYLSYRPFQYRKNQFGNLEFRGLIGLGTYTSGAVLFEFPSGYRVQVMTNHVGGTAGSARGISVELSPNGQVKVFGTLVGYILFGAVMTL